MKSNKYYKFCIALFIGMFLSLYIFTIGNNSINANASPTSITPCNSCKNGYSLWNNEGGQGFEDCNCHDVTGTPETHCTC